MINSIEEIINQPVVVVLYAPGASGEFISYALSQTIQEFSKTGMHWENENRCKFQDYFGRTLNYGPIIENVLFDRINLYFENIISLRDWHMGMAHYRMEYLEFLKVNGQKWPVIEITTINSVSKKFQYLAVNNKLKNFQQPTEFSTFSKKNVTSVDRGFNFPKNLQVEWSDLILTDTENTYNKIIKFLNANGNVDQFVGMVHDYLNRNQDLIKATNEN